MLHSKAHRYRRVSKTNKGRIEFMILITCILLVTSNVAVTVSGGVDVNDKS